MWVSRKGPEGPGIPGCDVSIFNMPACIQPSSHLIVSPSLNCEPENGGVPRIWSGDTESFRRGGWTEVKGARKCLCGAAGAGWGLRGPGYSLARVITQYLSVKAHSTRDSQFSCPQHTWQYRARAGGKHRPSVWAEAGTGAKCPAACLVAHPRAYSLILLSIQEFPQSSGRVR